MDFLRAVSIILVVMNVYWFCYEAIRLWGVDIGVVDRILMNFNRTAGLFHSILYTKLFHRPDESLFLGIGRRTFGSEQAHTARYVCTVVCGLHVCLIRSIHRNG